jgi:hypothetical protein
MCTCRSTTPFGFIITNSLEISGVTNYPSRYYRVRLVP